ncbi:ATP-binding protein [Achromobacter pestifer]|uniref:Virulence sensor protein BvgS n=1 Tax=Achromobacter pestifer TaxID=1353889 RepID=A0A6S7A766_9BURK|nr:ATP-binding protein [Achromobacter pestifer]CAB3714611.1 Virulence sensor protein BvgS [Achromobacter pestifer]
MDPAPLVPSFQPSQASPAVRLGKVAAVCAIPAYMVAADFLSALTSALAGMWGGLVSWVCLAGFVAALVALLLLGRKNEQHKRSEERLKDLVAFQTGVLDAIPQPIVLRGEDLKFLACNSAFERLLNRSRKQLRTKSVSAAAELMVREVESTEIEEDYRQVLATGTPLSKDRTVRVSGREMDVQHWIEPLRNAGGAVVGVVGGWMDITQRQRVMKELAVARDRAESANRTKTTFLASISHEIRTPMNAIMGMLELTLSHAELPEQDRLQLSTAYSASQSLLALIGDLLDLSKMEAGKFQFLPQPTNLCQLTEDVVDVFEPIAAAKGLDLTLTIERPESVARAHSVDPLRLKQILNNFVSNAIRFTERGSIRVHMEAEPPEGGRQTVLLKVVDTGVGIPSQALDTLLEPFVQVQETIRAMDRGTGLGLSICDRLVKKMGGTIQIDSELGVGTTMSVRLSLPVALAQQPESASDAAPVTQVAPACTGLNVLVVDDQASNVLLLQRQLEKLGHRVSSACNGLEALKLMGLRTFDIVVCDCAMPVMDGHAFARTLRQRGGTAATLPILGYTAGAHDAEIDRAREAGMDEILIKPVNLDSLNRAIATLMHRDSVPSAAVVPVSPSGAGG